MRRLWLAFTAVMVLSFLVLGWIGTRIYQEMPPLPERVVTTSGQTVIDTGSIQAGQNVWQSLGGMEVGSIWGTAAMSRRTGRRIGCTARRSSFSIAGRRQSSPKSSMDWMTSSRPN